MYRQYLKQAWQLMKQNRFFSAIYIIGTGLAISMVMVMAVVYHIRTANMAPEVHRDRMCYLETVNFRMNDNNGSLSFSCGPRLVKEVLHGLKTPEAVTVTTSPFARLFVVGDIFLQVPGRDEAPKVMWMGCDAAFWRVYSFRFLSGKPFTEADVQSALPRIVLAESMARRLFGNEEATGKTVLVDEVEYTVSGVVADVSGTASDVCAEAWLPYTSMSAVMAGIQSEKEGSAGLLVANFLLRDPADHAALNAELAREVKRYNASMATGQVVIDDPKSYGERALTNLFMMDAKTTYTVLAVVLLLFLLVPALNLSGLNTSHMQDRVPELGVRKAFGAPRATLLWQIFVENMMLMLPGGVAGLLFSYVLVFLFRNILLVSSLKNMMMNTGESIFLSAGMLLNWTVFGYTFAVCLVLNLLSSMVPAWRAVKVDITKALSN